MSATQQFLTRVVAWPGGQPGYVNIHWTLYDKNDPAKQFWSGVPSTTLQKFIDTVNWGLNKKNVIKDIYYCLSTQEKATKNRAGRAKPLRHHTNVTAVKALWLDVDVKDPPKGYATLEDAVAAVVTFCKDASLPTPTALVASGGGLHVYWISDKPLTEIEWRPYAEGLKALALKHNLRCDAGVTSDIVRILRVPGTLNHKTNPPKPVKLLHLEPADYDFAASLALLPTIAPHVTASITADTVDMGALRGQRPAFGKLDDSLDDGLGYDDTLLDPVGIFKGCPWLANALKTGGKDYAQPEWNLTTLAATFMEDGNAIAHAMGRLHPGYSRGSTDSLWDRKLKERDGRGLGWPSCGAIQSAGSAHCKTCPHFGKIKSPLSLAVPLVAHAAQQTQPKTNAPVVFDLPRGYGFDQDGYIGVVVVQKDKDDSPVQPLIPLFRCKWTKEPYMQKTPTGIVFRVSTDKGSDTEVMLKLTDITNSAELSSSLSDQDVLFSPKYIGAIQEFFVSFMQKLQEAAASIQARPFGWYQKDGVGPRTGFIYGGHIFHSDKSVSSAGVGDSNLRKQYLPTGTSTAWHKAAALFCGRNRPDLEIICAASFAAPLMTLTGQNCVTLSVWGESGGGKTTALSTGLAVWGHPKLSKEVQQSTARSIVKRMEEIRNLPLYWDEIFDPSIQAHVFKVLFSSTEGVGASRLNVNAETKPRGLWNTLMTICSNHSFIDYIESVQKTTDAGVLRTFEYEIKKMQPGGTGTPTHEATRLVADLESNFGHMGLRYARVLGSDPEGMLKLVTHVQNELDARLKPLQPERFWTVVMACIIVGAQLANAIGANFSEKEIKDFLIKQFYENRRRQKDNSTVGGTAIHTEEVLTQFFKAYMGESLYTDKFPAPGKVLKNSVKPLWWPDARFPRGIQVQYCVDSRVIRFSRPEFYSFLETKKTMKRPIVNGLVDHFNMKSMFVKLGAGTQYGSGQEHVFQIDVKPGSALEELLDAHASYTQPVAVMPAAQPDTSQQGPQQ